LLSHTWGSTHVITVRPNQIAAALLLTSLATSAYFFAQGTTSLAASRLFGIDEAEIRARGAESRRPNGAAPAASRRTVSASAILERNIFEPPSLNPDAGVTGEVVPVGQPIDLDTQNAPPCPSDHRVLGAVINPAAPSWSYAALAQGATPAILYRVGQSFAGKQVLRIDSGFDPDEPVLPGGQHRPRHRVVLQDPGGQYCQVTMFATAAQASGTPAATTPAAAPGVVPPGAAAAVPPPAPGGELAAGELDQGIVRVSDTQFTVQRSVMERALAQQDTLFRSARLIPNEDNGTVTGMKVYGIRRSSVLGRLGLQNGDVLMSADGQPLSNADALVQAYQSLGRSGNFSISVTRRGQPMTLTYQVQ